MAAALEHWVPVMFDDVRQAVEIARLRRRSGTPGSPSPTTSRLPAGFTSVHPSGENPFGLESEFTDPFVVAATMLAVTTRLKVMTYVYIVTMRDPWSVAKGAGTLSLLSGGRFGLGVGAGWLLEEIELLGHDPSTRGQADGRRPGHDPLAASHRPRRLAPRARTWRCARCPRSRRRSGWAARAAPPSVGPLEYDGWLGMNYPTEETIALLDRLAELRAEHGGVAPDAMTLALPIAVPSPALHDELAGHGATATLGMPWMPGDPDFAPLQKKVAALEAWSAQFGLT